MYKIFVNSPHDSFNKIFLKMKYLYVIFTSLMFISCGSETIINDCFPGITVNQVINLSNPEFINLQVPNGSATTFLNARQVLIIRRNSRYQAFDLECPERDCATAMSFDDLKMTCSCSDKKYNALNGSPDNGQGCFALEYTTNLTSSSTLQITR